MEPRQALSTRQYITERNQRRHAIDTYRRTVPPRASSPMRSLGSDILPEMVISMRVRQHYVSKAAVVCAGSFSISSIIVLAAFVFVEMHFPGRFLFSPRSKFRRPFFADCIVALAMLSCGFIVQFVIWFSGRQREYAVGIPHSVRYFIALGFLWVSASLVVASSAYLLLFIGMKKRSDIVYAQRQDLSHIWVLPLFAGVGLATIHLILALICLWNAVIAIESLKPSPHSAPRLDDRNDGPTVAEQEERNNASRDWEMLSRSQTALHPSSSSMNAEDGSCPIQTRLVEDQQAKQEMEDKLAKLQRMGFTNRQQNYNALCRSNFVLEVAAQRLLDIV